ncbi:MAG TPA: hypothetical protein VFW22_07935 [Pseudolabrys sp.]|nr:hypothetical protein [Pseudolabrys sp.]
MNQRPSLREALARADVAELDEAADTIGQMAGQAIAMALADVERPPPERFRPSEEEERERLQDAALADAIEMVNRHRVRLGRRVCSRPDGTTTRKIYELLRAMAGPDGGCDSDPSFQ